MPCFTSRRQSGSALLEALIAFLVLSIGMLAIVRAQAHWRLNAEVSRERSEAVRLAQQEIESLRAFSDLATFEAIADSSRSVDTGTRYQLTREAGAGGGLQARKVRVVVAWVDRSGEAQQISLSSVVAGVAPAYGGALGLARGTLGARGAGGRSSLIPVGASQLSDGRSAFKPATSSPVVFVFDNASGQLTARCTSVVAAGGLTVASLTGCEARAGYLISGVVRFSGEAPLPFTMAASTSSGHEAAAPWCIVEPMAASAGDRLAAYFCVVSPEAGGTWSGRTSIVPVGWTIGSGHSDRRVCRYSADLDGSGAIDTNIEHPASYTGVDKSLPNQNFLVTTPGEPCPAGESTGAASHNADPDLSTAQHQP